MTTKYNLFFIPEFSDRKKISKLRRNICKKVHSTQALQYPVHMSLISGGFGQAFLLNELMKLLYFRKNYKN